MFFRAHPYFFEFPHSTVLDMLEVVDNTGIYGNERRMWALGGGVGKVVTRRGILIDWLADGDVGFVIVVALDNDGCDYDGKDDLRVAGVWEKDM